jgi:hypothetical protein
MVAAELHVAYGKLASQLGPSRRADANRRLEAVPPGTGIALLARDAALLQTGGTLARDELRERLRDGLTALDHDHDATVRKLRLALAIADTAPDLVEPADLGWLTRFAEADIRDAAHALIARRGRSMPQAPIFDRTVARALSDAELVERLAEPHVVGRAALVAEGGRRELATARGVIVRAAHDAIGHAGPAGNLLDPDALLLDAAVQALVHAPPDEAIIALFDRMLRHSNPHVKWALLERAPSHHQLIEGMFVVFAQGWGWQAKVARTWLEGFRDTEEFEQARITAGVLPLEDEDDEDEDDDDDDDDGDDDNEDDDDEEMN